MKVTPLDIRRKEFKRGLRGYAEEDVDIFLDDVADEYERLFQENMELQDRIQRLQEQIAGHSELKGALEKTLVSAQVQADEMKANARKEAELTLKDAELKARGIVNDSYAETQRVQQTLVQLKHLEEDFRFKFRSLLDGYIKLLDEGPIAGRGAPGAAAAQAAPVSRPSGEDPVVPERDDDDHSLESPADYAVSADETPPELPGDTAEVEDFLDETETQEGSAVPEYTFRVADVESKTKTEAEPVQAEPAPVEAAQPETQETVQAGVAADDTQEDIQPQGFFFGKREILEEAELFRITPPPVEAAEGEEGSSDSEQAAEAEAESEWGAAAESAHETAGADRIRVVQREGSEWEDTREDTREEPPEQPQTPRLERTSRQRDDEPLPDKFPWPDEDTKEDSRDFEW